MDTSHSELRELEQRRKEADSSETELVAKGVAPVNIQERGAPVHSWGVQWGGTLPPPCLPPPKICSLAPNDICDVGQGPLCHRAHQ